MDGKVAFIADGSSGIKLGVTLGFARAGAKVALISRSPERIEAAAQGLREAGQHAIGIATDVRNFLAIDQAIAATRDTWGELLGTFNAFRATCAYIRKPGASLIAITAGQAVRPMINQIHVCAAKAGSEFICQKSTARASRRSEQRLP